jgi:arylsulfatase A-like enzyme
MRLGSLAEGCLLAVVFVPMAPAAERSGAQRPSIVYIPADDLGYGDVRCFNAQGKIATPHLDRLAARGMRFTDAHSSSAVCTPTRYGILTGRYNEGGHHVPFIVRWPGKVKPGTVRDQVICLTDLFSTCAAILGTSLPDTAAEDSVSFLPALLGTASAALRTSIVHHSVNGSFAIRQGSWKLVLCPDSGGWSAPRPGSDEAKGLSGVQLYDLSIDSAERHNVQAEHPETVVRLTKLLEQFVADGRSTPGAAQRNDGSPVVLHKKRSGAK